MPRRGGKSRRRPKDDPFYLQTREPSGPQKKSRSIVYQPGRQLTEREYWHRDGFYPPLYDIPRYPLEDKVPPRFLGTQITESEGHQYRKLSASGPDLGGDFSTTKQYVLGLHGRNRHAEARIEYRPGHIGFDTEWFYYSGPVYPVDLRGPNGLGPQGLFPSSIHSSDEELNEKGATAVARCKPTNSVANVATALGELRRDGLPHLPLLRSLKDKTSAAKAAGDEFLNVEFGWAPVVNDLKSFYEGVTTARAVIRQYRRDSGRVVRRHYEFPIVKETVVRNRSDFDPSGWYGYPSWAYVPSNFRLRFPPEPKLVVETTRRIWFDGAFTYYLPLSDDKLSALVRWADEADKVGGIIPTPEVLWNLAPWSWAIDWFSNTGDVISSISDQIFDGLVIRYGYIMEHSVVKHTYTCENEGLVNDQELDIPPLTFVTETKLRRKANPFGFGITWDGLSPLQVAITTALGLSRGR